MARTSHQSNTAQDMQGAPDSAGVAEPPADDESKSVLGDLADRCESNAEALSTLLRQVAEIHGVLTIARSDHVSSSVPAESAGDTLCSDETQSLRDQVDELEAQVAELEQQNSDLAAQVASGQVQRSVSEDRSGNDETLSWEERKEQILRQMEEETFDSEAFIQSLDSTSCKDQMDPIEYVENLQGELDRRCNELDSKDEKIRELQCLLDQQSETREGGVAIGAAAIAGMFDTDELVREERERLQQLQEEWEEKFRQAEIDASLERAKLSRERQEVAKKMSELEEQLAHHRRESRLGEGAGDGTSRRWMAKLGLSETEV